MQRYVDFIAAKRRLAAALHSGVPAFEALPAYFDSRFEPVLQRLRDAAVAAGEICPDANPHDLLRAVASLCMPSSDGSPSAARRRVALLVDGLRYRAAGPQGRGAGVPHEPDQMESKSSDAAQARSLPGTNPGPPRRTGVRYDVEDVIRPRYEWALVGRQGADQREEIIAIHIIPRQPLACARWIRIMRGSAPAAAGLPCEDKAVPNGYRALPPE